MKLRHTLYFCKYSHPEAKEPIKKFFLRRKNMMKQARLVYADVMIHQPGGFVIYDRCRLVGTGSTLVE